MIKKTYHIIIFHYNSSSKSKAEYSFLESDNFKFLKNAVKLS